MGACFLYSRRRDAQRRSPGVRNGKAAQGAGKWKGPARRGRSEPAEIAAGKSIA